MKMNYGIIAGTVIGLSVTRMALADPSAYDLIRNGDSYVGVQSKDKILKIYSEKSVVTLEPNIWHVIYFDPDTTFKATDVKFGAGQEMEITHPMVNGFPMPSKAMDILDPARLKIDSGRALHIAASQPLLKNLTLRVSKMTLSRTDDGTVWKVEFWAAKVGDPSKNAGVGSVTISAYDGSILGSDLHPDSVN
jgi:hypothetical protein